MSSQTFSAVQREAIWEAYGRKCVYSHALLDVGNFHIDHVVPEALASNPEELEKAIAKLKLDSTFDVLNYENLVPCAPDRNLQKGSIVLNEAQAHFFLGIAASKKQSVIDQISRIEKRIDRGRAAVMLQQVLASGKLQPEDVAKILREHTGEPKEVFELLEAMSLVDPREIRAVVRSDLDELADLPVKLGENSGIDGVELTGHDNQKRTCRTCREYDAALREGYFAATTFDMTMAVWFQHQCGLLRALRTAKAPTQSFVSNPRVSLLDLHLVPYSFFPVLTQHEADAHTKTYQDKVDSGELVVTQTKSNMLSIEEPAGMSQSLIEVTRADFNGDGLEDILLFEYCRATEGTLRWGGIKLVTRTSANDMFSGFDPID